MSVTTAESRSLIAGVDPESDDDRWVMLDTPEGARLLLRPPRVVEWKTDHWAVRCAACLGLGRMEAVSDDGEYDVCKRCLGAGYFGIDAMRSTDARPGSFEKLCVDMARIAMGISIQNPKDRSNNVGFHLRREYTAYHKVGTQEDYGFD